MTGLQALELLRSKEAILLHDTPPEGYLCARGWASAWSVDVNTARRHLEKAVKNDWADVKTLKQGRAWVRYYKIHAG
jgi:predicted ArsR family transcriptional regulator